MRGVLPIPCPGNANRIQAVPFQRWALALAEPKFRQLGTAPSEKGILGKARSSVEAFAAMPHQRVLTIIQPRQ
jgi:hypothetical protein